MNEDHAGGGGTGKPIGISEEMKEIYNLNSLSDIRQQILQEVGKEIYRLRDENRMLLEERGLFYKKFIVMRVLLALSVAINVGVLIW